MNRRGFTLIELVMVILLLSVLAAVAIPNFIDFRVDAKNAATKGSLGALRSALSITRAAIALKEDPSAKAHKYPLAVELQANQFLSFHANLSGVNIMDPSSGIPTNPWTISTRPTAHRNSIINIQTFNPSSTCQSPTTRTGFYNGSCVTYSQFGWGYAQTNGEVWPASALNGGKTGATCSTRMTENCY